MCNVSNCLRIFFCRSSFLFCYLISSSYKGTPHSSLILAKACLVCRRLVESILIIHFLCWEHNAIPSTGLNTVNLLSYALRHSLQHSSILMNLLGSVFTTCLVSLSLSIKFIVSLSNICTCKLAGFCTFYNTLGNLSILSQCIAQLGRINQTALEQFVSLKQLLVIFVLDVFISNSQVLVEGINKICSNLTKSNEARTWIILNCAYLDFSSMPISTMIHITAILVFNLRNN